MYQRRVQTFQEELTRQPYAGYYLFYLVFEEFSDEYKVAEMALANATQIDFIVHISLMEDELLEEGLKNYFDMNRRMRLADKFNEERSTQVLDQVINILVSTSEAIDAKRLISAEV